MVRNSSTVAKTVPMATNVTNVFTAALPREGELSRRVCGLGHDRSDGQQLNGPIQEQSAGSTVVTGGDLRSDGFSIAVVEQGPGHGRRSVEPVSSVATR